MTSAKLRELLDNYPPHRLVKIDGYEDIETNNAAIRDIKPNVNEECFPSRRGSPLEPEPPAN